MDFCLVRDGMPEMMIEAKRSDATPGRSILEFHRKYGIPGIQLVMHLKHERVTKDIEIRRGLDYLRSLGGSKSGVLR